jgi:hypothetical protein
MSVSFLDLTRQRRALRAELLSAVARVLLVEPATLR